MSLWNLLRKVGTQNVSPNIIKSIANNASVIQKMPFYAVAKGRTAGIFMSWPDCEAQVKGFAGARYKKFDTVVGAQEFITAQGGKTAPTKYNQPGNSSSSSNNVSQSNLKRSYTTSTSNQVERKKSNKIKQDESDDDDQFSDDSDDLNAVLSKQMDDIEARIKGFKKGVDKILKKNSSKPRQSILIEPPQPKKRRKSGAEFDIDGEGFVHVYTDGACSANGTSGAKAGLGVFWSDCHPLNLSMPVSGRATNNCGEIQAATMAIRQALGNGITKLAINTDSQFLINSVTKWMPGWKRKGWKIASGAPVKNEKDFKELDSLQHKLQIKWIYVEAHKGVHGNEMADELAKAGATIYK